MNPRRLLGFLASLIITAIFLAIALYPVDFAKLGRALVSADYRLVPLAALFTCTGYVLRTARWQRLLAPSKIIPLSRLFPVLVVGFALNNLLPGRPGEFARAYALGKREGLSKTLGLGTVVVERVADGIALIAFLLLALLAFPSLGLRLPLLTEVIFAIAIFIFGFALLVLFFLLTREEIALALVQRVTRHLPQRLKVPWGFAHRLDKMLASFVVGLHSLRSSRDVAAVALLSLAVWTVEGISYLLILSAFGVLSPLFVHSVASAMMMVLINLGIMIPAAPGGLGPYEAAGIFSLGVFGVEESIAASVALSMHTMQYLLITILGIIFAWREGLALGQTREENEEE